MHQIDLLTAARRLAGAERILLLTHRRPPRGPDRPR